MFRLGQPFQKHLNRAGQLRHRVNVARVEDQGAGDQAFQIKPPVAACGWKGWAAIIREAPTRVKG